MFNFFHQYKPVRILFQAGAVSIYWYGVFVVSGMIAGMAVAIRLGKKYGQSAEMIFDMAFWMIFSGVIGARLYHVALESGYYSSDPVEIFKIWNGGLAIHGAVIAGFMALVYFSRKHKADLWLNSSILVAGIALGQAIGRWGNYFNQELFGFPTDSFIGISIAPANRPPGYSGKEYFHPAFLYESVSDLALFVLIMAAHKYIKTKPGKHKIITALYFCGYAMIRFFLEMVRIDVTPRVFGLRAPQLASVVVFFMGASLYVWGRKDECIEGNRLEKNTDPC
jgi:phosphatidylglycerol---prolipoprotein diacylglyceryl transferase